MDRVAQFRVDIGAHRMDFSGQPECFKSGDDAFANAAFFPYGIFRIFVAHHFLIKNPLAGADGFAFRLGGVSG
jgi:hypothetical protein